MFRILLSIVLFLMGTETVYAAQVRIAVGLALPPYVLSEKDSGMEMDIVKAALKKKGHTVKPIYLPFLRVVETLDAGGAEAALTVNESSGMKGIHYSNTHITYQNVAVGLASKSLTVKNIVDLGQYSVIAFQNATKYLGPDFSVMTKSNKRYTEKAQQDKQIAMLYSDRTDLIVMDINIYKYYKKLEKRVSTDAKVDVFEVFPPTNYKVGFRGSKLRDDFNSGLKELKDSGEYQKIIDSYVK